MAPGAIGLFSVASRGQQLIQCIYSMAIKKIQNQCPFTLNWLKNIVVQIENYTIAVQIENYRSSATASKLVYPTL